MKLLGRDVPSKYHAQGQEFNGRRYDSKMEAAYAGELEFRRMAGDIKSWRPQVTIPLHVGNYHVCDYRIDFEVTHNDESIEYVEVKGFETPLWQLKWKIFEALYGDRFKLTVVK